MRIGVIGTGTIATAVVRGIANDGHTIVVSKRSASKAAELAADFDNVRVADNQDVLDRSEVVFLGLMADQAPDILGALTFRPDQHVISFMAGATLSETAVLVAPANASAIVMPFPGVAQGGSLVMMQGDEALVTEVLGRRNRVFALGTAQEMQAYIAAQAVLSPAVKMVGDAAGWLESRVSDPEQAEEFLRVLVGSSLMGSKCAPLLEALNTPGGYNQRLREHMVASGMSEALTQGLDKLE